MNTGNFNSVTINAAPSSALQRLVMTVVAYARRTARGRVMAGTQVLAMGRVAKTVAARAFINGAFSVLARTAIAVTNNVRFAVDATARAQVTVQAQIAVRGWVNASLVLRADAVGLADSHIAVSGPLLHTASALIALGGQQVYTLHRYPVAGIARALVVLDFSTRRQIPYDEDAPVERTMFVAAESRLMVVY